MNINNIECCICLEYNDKLKNTYHIFNILPCNHIMCLGCLCEMITYECPLCRYNFKKILPGRIINMIDTNSNKIKNKNKIYPINTNDIDFNNEYQFPPLFKRK